LGGSESPHVVTTKIVITSFAQLQKKYGTAGVSRIQSAINGLIAADARRSIQTQVLALDNVADMQKVNAPVVTKASDPRQNKIAIDAIYRTFIPEYLVLLGATDVIPHQDLKNPIEGDKVDKDEFAWGDIPYACEAPYSQQPKDFIGPSRVVGRIPDITNATDPSHLLKLLGMASNWRSRDPEDYADYLGISAWVWRKSTERSLRHVFGCADALQISPPRGPRWNRSLISRRLHFVNCHGSPSSPHFYGQRGKHHYPISHTAWWLSARLSEGTVAAAECCYGARLYDPAPVPNQQIGICSTYLANGAYGFFGSTTIAYGYCVKNAWADLICQFFLKNVLAGASLGRAALEARQQYAQSRGDIDPADLKTLAQFNLLGDPSIQPVQLPAPDAEVKLVGRMRTAQTRMDFATYERSSRRRQLFEMGTRIAETRAVAVGGRPMEPGTPIANSLREPEFLSFSIDRPTAGGFVNLHGRLLQPTAFKVAIGKAGPTVHGVAPLVLLIAEEWNGEIVLVKKGFSR
jgi:hypothetical protein